METKGGLARLPEVRGRLGWPWTEETTAPEGAPGAADWPSISVLCPSFNQGAFIEETIRSVALQNYPRCQLVIIDGGSRDATRDVVARYRDVVDVFVSEPDRGQSDALNKGLARATGEIIGWLNSDDTYQPGTLFHVAEVFKSQPAVEWVSGACEWHYEDTGDRVLTQSVPDAPLAEWLMGCPVQTPATFWSRRLQERVGDFDAGLHYVMDADLFTRFRLAGASPAITPRQLATLRVHGSSKSGSLSHRFREELMTVLYPRHVSRLPPADQVAARGIGARKLLRMAETDLRGKRISAGVRHGLGAVAMSPREALRAALGRLTRGAGQALER